MFGFTRNSVGKDTPKEELQAALVAADEREIGELRKRIAELTLRNSDLEAEAALAGHRLARITAFMSAIGIEPGAVLDGHQGAAPEHIARILTVTVDQEKADVVYRDAPAPVAHRMVASARHQYIRGPVRAPRIN